jgi:hypothetical protein
MTTIPENLINDYEINKTISAFFKEYRVGQILKKSNTNKAKGIPVVTVFLYLVQLVFTNKSMYMNILNGTNPAGFAKDVVYRLLNATFINWSTFQLSLSMAVTTKIAALTSKERLHALIIDDTVFERSRSKKVELLANIYDHAATGRNKFKRGFRMLTLAWSDGVTTIPMLFRHLSSKEKKNRYNEINPDIDKRSVGFKIRQEALSSATDVLLLMLSQAKKMAVPARHVVFDSWFSFPSTMMSIRKIGFDAVGRLKDTTKIMYLINGTRKTLKQIYNEAKKRPGKAKYLLSVEVFLYNDKNETMPARIVFVRDRNNRSKWIAFGTTDMSLTEEQIIQLYKKRWDIEVFFKISKSYLKLAGEFQGLSYDFITAHTTVVMTRYIILAVQKRSNEDPRSIGELFHLLFDEMADICFSDALTFILNLLCSVLSDCLFISEAQIKEIIDRFVAKLSRYFKAFFIPPLPHV